MKVVGFAAMWASTTLEKRDCSGRRIVVARASTLPEPNPNWADRAISDYYYGTNTATQKTNAAAGGGGGVGSGGVVAPPPDVRSPSRMKYARPAQGSLMDDVCMEVIELSDRGKDFLFEYSNRLMVRKSIEASRATRSACAAVGCGFCGSLIAWSIFSSLAPLGLVAGATAGATLALADARPVKRRRSPFEKLLLAWTRACTACVFAGWVRLRKMMGDASSDIKLRAENFDYQTFSLKDWASDVDDRLHVTDKAKSLAQNATQFFESTFKTGRSLVKDVSLDSITGRYYTTNDNKRGVYSYSNRRGSNSRARPARRRQTPRHSFRRQAPTGQQRKSGVGLVRDTALAAPKKILTGLKRLVPPALYQQPRQGDVIVVPQPNSIVQSFLPVLALIAYDRSTEISSALDIVRVSVDEFLASIPHLPFFTHFF